MFTHNGCCGTAGHLLSRQPRVVVLIWTDSPVRGGCCSTRAPPRALLHHSRPARARRHYVRARASALRARARRSKARPVWHHARSRAPRRRLRNVASPRPFLWNARGGTRTARAPDTRASIDATSAASRRRKVQTRWEHREEGEDWNEAEPRDHTAARRALVTRASGWQTALQLAHDTRRGQDIEARQGGVARCDHTHRQLPLTSPRCTPLSSAPPSTGRRTP